MKNNKQWEEETKHESATPGAENGTPYEPSGPPSDWAYFQYDLVDDEAYKAEFLSKFDLVRKRKVTLDKPLAVIFDPNAGKRNDIMPIVSECFYNG